MSRTSMRLVVVCLLTSCLGCEAPVQIQPGRAALRVRVRAEPKIGYRAPADDRYGGSDGPLNVGAFERVDYSSLGNIVVWVEPSATVSDAPAPPTVVLNHANRDSAARRPGVYATGVGGELVVRNHGLSGEAVYSVSDGNAFDLGTIRPGGEARHVVRSPGVIEILGSKSDKPIGLLYVAPSPWVSLARSKQTVTFTDLPPGPARAVCWHPRLPGSQVQVDLKPDAITRTDLTVGVNALPKAP